jgi:hypothetical protein
MSNIDKAIEDLKSREPEEQLTYQEVADNMAAAAVRCPEDGEVFHAIKLPIIGTSNSFPHTRN